MIGAATTRVRNPSAKNNPHTNSTAPTTYTQNKPFWETDALEEFGGGTDIAEQDRKALHGERTASHHANQRLGDRRESAINATESRIEQTRLLLHGHPRPLQREQRTGVRNMRKTSMQPLN
jgi:hypothetical protein